VPHRHTDIKHIESQYVCFFAYSDDVYGLIDLSKGVIIWSEKLRNSCDFGAIVGDIEESFIRVQIKNKVIFKIKDF
jgi:hypothetical protein